MDKNIKYVIVKWEISSGNITVGKSYDVLDISSVEADIVKAAGVNDVTYFNIKDDNGDSKYIWSGYFYSTEEIRKLVIEEILNG